MWASCFGRTQRDMRHWEYRLILSLIQNQSWYTQSEYGRLAYKDIILTLEQKGWISKVSNHAGYFELSLAGQAWLQQFGV